MLASSTREDEKRVAAMIHGDRYSYYNGLQIPGWWFPPTRPRRFKKLIAEGQPQTPGSHHPGSLHSQLWLVLIVRWEPLFRGSSHGGRYHTGA